MAYGRKNFRNLPPSRMRWRFYPAAAQKSWIPCGT
nr:MAG TPA: hypothetical protein [Caudoviricetes sp.]